MQIQTDLVDGKVVITLSGRPEPGLDDDLKAAVDRLLDDGHREFVVNLNRAMHIDSAALGAIIRAYTHVSRSGGTLELEGLGQRIREIIGRSGLMPLFEPGASIEPFLDPLNPRLGEGYRKAAVAAVGMMLIVVVVAMIVWTLR